MLTHSINKHTQSIFSYKSLLSCIRQHFNFSRQKRVLFTFHPSLSLSLASFLKGILHTHFLHTTSSSTIRNQEKHLALIHLENISIVAQGREKQHPSSEFSTILPPIQLTLRLSCSLSSSLLSSHADYRDYSLPSKVNYIVASELCQNNSPLSSLSSTWSKNPYKSLDQNGTWYVVESCKRVASELLLTHVVFLANVELLWN